MNKKYHQSATRIGPQHQSSWFERLFSEYARSVYRWVLFFGIDDAGAEEVTQEVFITALKKRGSVETEAEIPAWLFQIARRHAANYRRSAWMRRIFGRASQTSALDLLPARDGGHEEADLETRRILGHMPVKLVEVLIMHDMDGYTREEISRILELPPGTVASRIRSARALFVRAWNSKVTS